MNICVWKGVLVGPRQWIPDDPFHAAWRADFGCNHLACSACGRAVRNAPNVTLPRGQDLKELADAEDWTSLLQPAAVRLYACACQSYATSSITAVHPREDDLEDFAGSRRWSWGCAGHPYLRLPSEVDGIPVEQFDARVPEVLSGAIRPPHAHARALWLLDLRQFGGEEGRVLDAAVARCLSHPDAAIRVGAMGYFRDHPAIEVTEEAAFEKLSKRELRQADPLEQYESLGQTWLRVARRWLLAQGEPGARDIELARGLARQKGGAEMLARWLAIHDTAWLLDNAEGIAAKTPGETRHLVACAHAQGQLADMLDRLTAAKGVTKAKLQSAIRLGLPRPLSEEILAARG